MSIPQRVKLIDVGPRDGLQNEKFPVPAEVKIGLVHRLQDGLPLARFDRRTLYTAGAAGYIDYAPAAQAV